MTTQEIYKIAEETANQFNETVTVNVWKEQRVYLNRPSQSKKYQEVGYVRISDFAVFPASPNTRTEREREAIKMLEKVAENLKNGKVAEKPVAEFKSMLPW